MKFDFLKQNISSLVIFGKNTLRSLENCPNNLDANIKYWLKKGEIISLKKGLYILRDTYNKISVDDILEFIANQLMEPSYLSFEYVLSKYQLLTEPVRALTSATTKKTLVIKNALGTFRYYSISPQLFTAYQKKQKGNIIIWEAKKSKAMFDYLYLHFFRQPIINKTAIEDLRINWENISKTEFKDVCSYEKLVNNKRLKKALAIIKKEYYA